MRGTIKFFLIGLVFIGVVAFLAQGQFAQVEKVLSYETNPCLAPLRYRVASIDPKFDLTEEQVLKDINQAVSLWNKAYGSNLFVYDSKGELPIYFIYDKRQALSTQINQLESKLNKGGANLDSQMTGFKQKVADYEARLAAYNQEVASWNAKGGAPKEEFDKLNQTSEDLKKEANSLNTLAKQLNLQAKDYNSQVGTLNTTINSFNDELSQKPEEGIYIEEKTSIFDQGNKKIEIYFMPSRNELIHTLAHEFGHALHIDHNGNPKSIMYSYTSQSLLPSQDDINSLKEACKSKSLTQVLKEKANLIQGNFQRMFPGQ